MAQIVINEAALFLGVKQGDNRHKNLINKYNSIKPLPVGYAMKYTDDWCAAFVTVIGDLTGASILFGRECGVQRYINIFKNKGIWLGRAKPQAGDLVTFDWDGNGWSDHIGIVEKIVGNTITTIEGNTSRRVDKRTYLWNDKRISGYARPKYLSPVPKPIKRSTVEEIAREVMIGSWGNGELRKQRLTVAGYDSKAVQEVVNRLSKTNSSSLKSNDTIAREVINGKWGNGKTRKNRLINAGYNYLTIQNIVNKLV